MLSHHVFRKLSTRPPFAIVDLLGHSLSLSLSNRKRLFSQAHGTMCSLLITVDEAVLAVTTEEDDAQIQKHVGEKKTRFHCALVLKCSAPHGSVAETCFYMILMPQCGFHVRSFL